MSDFEIPGGSEFPQGGMIYKGSWDASAGTFPGGGLAETGWVYYVSVAGTVDGVEFAIGDNLVAEVDNASTTTYAANWRKQDQTDEVTPTNTVTFTNKRITSRVTTITSSATPALNLDTTDHLIITAQAVDITSFTTNLTGTATDGQKVMVSITGTAARAITWGASFENGPVALPTTTVTTTRLDTLFIWNAVTSKLRCMASGSTA